MRLLTFYTTLFHQCCDLWETRKIEKNLFQRINSKLPQKRKNSGGVLVKVELKQITHVIETDFFFLEDVGIV